MYDGRTKLADQVSAEVRKHFGETVLRTVIPRSVKVSEAPGFGQTVLAYDPGSRGAMSYIDAAREIAERGVDGQQRGLPRGRAVDAVAERKGGLGRGLAALIPTGPPPTELATREGTSAAMVTAAERATSAGAGAAVGRRRAGHDGRAQPELGGRRVLPRDRGVGGPARTRSSRAPRSTRTRWPSWSTRSASSACCSRSWCARPTTAPSSWSWASAGGGPRSAPGCSGCPRSCATPATTRCCATRCWRTSTGSSSTRWTRPPPTSSCSPSSGSRTPSWPTGSAAAARS